MLTGRPHSGASQFFQYAVIQCGGTAAPARKGEHQQQVIGIRNRRQQVGSLNPILRARLLDVQNHHTKVAIIGQGEIDGREQSDLEINIVGQAEEKRREHGERAEQDDGHGDGGNQRGPEILQEQIHDEEDQRDGGRGDGGILRNGQRTNRERTRDHEDDGNHPGEDRAVDEEFGFDPGFICTRTFVRTVSRPTARPIAASHTGTVRNPLFLKPRTRQKVVEECNLRACLRSSDNV